jgi:hypothetical protein
MRLHLGAASFRNDGGIMAKYMLLLYREDQEQRTSEIPLWIQFNESLRDAGILIAGDPLHPVDAATTVRVRNDETEILDGPFAVTKEYLAGYYLLECADLDEALKHAARVPLVRYGSVEVRPVMDMAAMAAAPASADGEAAAAR